MRTVFLGDSITGGFIELERHGIINLGVIGHRTLEIIERLTDVKSLHPERLFLMVGVNDVLTNNHIGFTDFPIATESTYEFIVHYLANNLSTTDIYLLSVLPVRSLNIIHPSDEKKINQDIDRLNQQIEKLAKQYGFNYINLNSDFKDTHGSLKQAFTTDGIHLSQQGYQFYYEKIKKLL